MSSAAAAVIIVRGIASTLEVDETAVTVTISVERRLMVSRGLQSVYVKVAFVALILTDRESDVRASLTGATFSTMLLTFMNSNIADGNNITNIQHIELQGPETTATPTTTATVAAKTTEPIAATVFPVVPLVVTVCTVVPLCVIITLLFVHVRRNLRRPRAVLPQEVFGFQP
jgi:hypothetical protein